jgi:phage terminase large subunit
MSFVVEPPDPKVAAWFIQSVLKQRHWRKQHDIRESVFTRRMTLVQSCTGSGKTKAAADIALAWLLTGPDRMVVTTAPTHRQVVELLWKELRLSYAAGSQAKPLGGELAPESPRLKIGDGWLATGFSSADEVNVQGWHSRGGTLFILDEAVGVKRAIWDAVEGTTTGAYDRVLALGNPTTPEGRFWELCKADQHRIKISAHDVIHYGKGMPGLSTEAWIADRRVKWGEQSPLWIAKVLGEFPSTSDNALVPLAWWDAGVERWKARRKAKLAPLLPTDAGLDVARYGDDATVLARAWFDDGLRPGVDMAPVRDIVDLDVHRSLSTMEAAGLVSQARQSGLVSTVRVDADGLGAGVFDRLAELGLDVVEMRGGMRAANPDRFVNARSEWLWSLREGLRPDAEHAIAVPDDEELAFQATSLRYKLDSAGRIALESKDDWRARTKRSSTDELDAVAMALARGSGPKGVEVTIL